MVLAHITDSWTAATDRNSRTYFTLLFIGGVASPLFLFLAGLATAMSAASKARGGGDVRIGAAAARARGWEIFLLGLLFRVQSHLLGWGPLQNLFKVDMLNIMGLSIVAASYVWQAGARRQTRVLAFAALTAATTLATPLVRATPWLEMLPDPIEAYLRPAGPYAAFPLFPWAGFLFAGVLCGEFVDAVRVMQRRELFLQAGLSGVGGALIGAGWMASFQPALFPTASFWHDSPTLFCIRLGCVLLTVPTAWVITRTTPELLTRPLVTMGRSSLFVYWIHVEMVYGVVAEPLKQRLPLWAMLTATATMCVFLYALVIVKNKLLDRRQLRGPARVFAAVLR
jgi:uncharacterized membrane protein